MPNAANPTAIPGTANSDPFDPGNPAAARGPTNSCRMSATIRSGMTIRKMIVPGSVIITRNSWRMMEALARSDTAGLLVDLLVGFLVTSAGEPQVHGL